MSETNFPPLPNPGSNGNLLTSNGTIWTSAAPATTFPNVVEITKQKSETGADANVLTYTPPAVAGVYRLHFVADMSADNLAVLGWTATWKDSNGNAQSPDEPSDSLSRCARRRRRQPSPSRTRSGSEHGGRGLADRRLTTRRPTS